VASAKQTAVRLGKSRSDRKSHFRTLVAIHFSSRAEHPLYDCWLLISQAEIRHWLTLNELYMLGNMFIAKRSCPYWFARRQFLSFRLMQAAGH